ncbi:MAG: AmmeMemoRadiSam system protein A [Thiotrichales bacterium]
MVTKTYPERQHRPNQPALNAEKGFNYTDAEKAELLSIARESIRTGLESGEPLEVDMTALPDRLQEKRASFVTLNKQGRLRGCIGHIEPYLPLAVDVAKNAWAAATEDTRFQPVRSSELSDISISISILSLPEPLQFRSEQELLSLIHPGEDGLTLEAGYLRGVFLPSVWESIQSREEFIRQLKRKAGLPADYWSEEIKIQVFHSLYFSEQDVLETN